MLQFQGFKPAAMQRMAKTMGYSGDMGEFNKFLSDNPDKQDQMNVYSDKAKEMMMGGYVKGYATGGMVTPTQPPLEVTQPGQPISYEAWSRQLARPTVVGYQDPPQEEMFASYQNYVDETMASVPPTPPQPAVDYTQGPVPQSTGYQGGTITEAMADRAFTPGSTLWCYCITSWHSV